LGDAPERWQSFRHLQAQACMSYRLKDSQKLRRVNRPDWTERLTAVTTSTIGRIATMSTNTGHDRYPYS
jgi:hypothetical protein